MGGMILSIVVALIALTSTIHPGTAADPECIYRQIRNLPMHWANPTDCARFYRCTNRNIKRDVSCAGGKEYNPKTGKCSNAGKGFCKLSLVAPLAEESNICSNEVAGAYLPQDGRCRDFFICNDNIAYPQSCDHGSMFNATTANCVPDPESKCWQNYCITEANGTYLPDQEGRCRDFFICNDNIAYPQSCDHGSMFNATTANCVPDPESKCWQNYCITEANGTYLPDQEGRCRDFFICNDNIAYPQSCDHGSMFNATTANCVPDPESKCWQNYCITEANGTYLPDPISCLTFYVCDLTNAITQNCGPGSYFNRSDGNCQPDINNSICWENFCLNKTDGTMIKNRLDCHGYYKCQSEVATPQQCASGQYFDWKSNSCQLGKCPNDETTTESTTQDCRDTTTPTYCESCTCPGGYEEGQLLPYPDNCQFYYICSGGVLVQHSCGENNYFDEKIEACTVDVDGVCPECRRKNYRRAKRGLDDRVPEIATNKLKPSCLGLYFQDEMIAHDDCNKFQVCLNGELHTKECSFGDYFNSEKQACIRDENNVCNLANKGVQTAQAQRGTVDIALFRGNSGECTCPGGYTSGQIIAHPTDCDKYYVCDNGLLNIHECGQGNMFSSCDECCVPDNDNVCWPKDPKCSSDICSGVPDGQILPNPGDCTGFYQCMNGVPQESFCSGANEWFNLLQGKCEEDVNGQCVNPCANIKGIAFLPHADCRKFFFCNNGEAHIETCTTGSFDAKLGVCSPNAVCEASICTNSTDGTTFPVVGEKSNFYVCISGAPSIRSCLDNMEYNENLKLCLNAPSSNCNQNLCKGDNVPGAFQTLNFSSNSFCYCREDAAYETNCPWDYIFNPSLGVCFSNAPCDPEICLDNPEYTVTANRNNTNGFCLCVSKVQVPVECPLNETFYPKISRCRGSAIQDPNCNPTFCLDKPDYTSVAAPNTTAGFCVCQDGGSIYHSCTSGMIFNAERSICLPATFYCDVKECAKGANTIFPAFHDQYAFCYCQSDNSVELRNCPENSIFHPSQLVCLPELCDSDQCIVNPSGPFPAKDYLYGFCLCDGSGKAVIHECQAGQIFDKEHLVCTDEVNTECDISLCQQQGRHYPYDIPAIEDPFSFCYCLNSNTVEIFHCPINKMYDQKFGACLDQNVTPQPDCDTCTCPGGYPAGSLLPHRQYCRQYYICSQGVLHLENCGTGNFFNASAGYCQPDHNRACMENLSPCTCVGAYREGELVANPTNRHMYYRCLNAQLWQETCPYRYYFNSEQATCVLEFPSSRGIKARSIDAYDAVGDEVNLPCQKNSKRSVPSNCSQYEICQGNEWHRRTCTKKRYYNPEEQKCLEPRDDTVCIYAKVSGLPACNNDTDLQTLPYKNSVGMSNCSMYYRCSRNKWRLRSCAKNEFYSRLVRTCLPTSFGVSSCQARNVSESPAYTTSLSNLMTCEDTAVRAFGDDCIKYLMCLNGYWWHHYCPLGMYFNRTLNYCVPNDNDQCDTVVKPNGTEILETCRKGERREIPLNCTSYEVCLGGKWQRLSCERNFVYDTTLEQCLPNKNDQCSITNGLRKACFNGEIRNWPTPENCTQFHYCASDMWESVSCLKGHTYSEELRCCVPHVSGNPCQPVNQTILPILDETFDEKPMDVDTTIPDTVDEICVDQDDGIAVAHPTDCTRFYLCLNEIPDSEQKCTAGSFFDASIGYCRPNDGSCILSSLTSACQNATDGRNFSNPDNCQTYYHCSVQNGTQIISCADGQYFDEGLKRCRIDHGECRNPVRQKRNCVDLSEHGRRLQHELYCNIYYACVHGLAIPVQCPNGQNFNVTIELCTEHEESEVQCIIGNLSTISNDIFNNCVNAIDGSYLPNHTDCTSYFICSNDEAEPKRCPLGTYFDSQQLLCVPDDDGACPYAVIEVESVHDVHGGSDPPQPILTPPNPAVCDGKHGNMLPDPSNCNNFFICINGKLRHERCFAGYFFSTIINQCQSYDYSGKTTDLNIAVNSSTSDTILNTQFISEATKIGLRPIIECRDKPTNFSELCNASEGASIPEQGDCRRYINCKDSEPISQRCRNGESYDSILGFCRQNDGTCLLENGERVGECNKLHGTLTRDAENCRGYFVCVNGQKIYGECSENEFFDRLTSTCRKDVHQQCSSSPKKAFGTEIPPVSCQGLSESVLYPYIYDNCRSYFQCVKGSLKVQECADGLFFEAVSKRCVKEIRVCTLNVP